MRQVNAQKVSVDQVIAWTSSIALVVLRVSLRAICMISHATSAGLWDLVAFDHLFYNSDVIGYIDTHQCTWISYIDTQQCT